jgi:tetratricopeptide (TPR) repeat protein
VSDGTAYRTRTAKQEELPSSLPSLWQQRVEQALRNRPEDDRLALEMAATLGEAVELVEWRATLAAGGLSPEHELLDHLADLGLVLLDADGLTFAHGLLRDHLLDQAELAGRLGEHHRCVADVLLDTEGPVARRRAAEHLFLARSMERAEVLFADAIQEARLRGDPNLIHHLCERRLACLAALQTPREDRRWGSTALQLSHAERNLGGRKEAHARLLETLATGLQCGWTQLNSAARVALAGMLEREGDYAGAKGLLDAVLDPSFEANHPAEAGEAHNIYGWVHLRSGDCKAAHRSFDSAMDLIGTHGKPFRYLAAGTGKIHVLMVEQRLDEAGALSAELLEIASRDGFTARRGNLLYSMGAIAWERRELEASLDHFREAMDTFDQIGNVNARYVEVNVASVLVDMGRFAEARPFLRRMLDMSSTPIQPLVHAAVLASLLCCEAHAGDRTAFRTEMAVAERVLQPALGADRHYARFLRRAAELARAQTMPDEANRADALAERLESHLARNHTP